MNFIKSIFRIIGKVVFVLIIAIIVSFCINNPQVITVSLWPLPYEVETRLFLVILFCLFGGILIGFLCCSFKLTKEKCKNLANGWKINSLQKKVDSAAVPVEEKNRDQLN